MMTRFWDHAIQEAVPSLAGSVISPPLSAVGATYLDGQDFQATGGGSSKMAASSVSAKFASTFDGLSDQLLNNYTTNSDIACIVFFYFVVSAWRLSCAGRCRVSNLLNVHICS